MVRATGTVSINGMAIHASSALLPGDVLQVGPDSNAVISSKGVMIQVLANSIVLYRGRGLELKNGNLDIAATSGIIASVERYEVTPYGNSVKFQIAKNGSCGSVVAERGGVVLREGDKTTVVQTGTASKFGDKSCAESAGSQHAQATKGSHATRYVLAGSAATATFVSLVKKASPDSPDE